MGLIPSRSRAYLGRVGAERGRDRPGWEKRIWRKKKCGHKTRAPHHTSRGEVPSDRVEGGCHACALTSTARALLRSVKRSRALIADACEVATGNDFPLGSVEGEECAVASQSHARPVQRLLAGDVGTVLFVPFGGRSGRPTRWGLARRRP